jgi:DNA transposition AAA+ family ATPase
MISTRDELAKIMADDKISQAQLSRYIGVSCAQISLYLDGKYPGDVPNLERKIRGFLARHSDEKAAQRFLMPIIKTTVMKNIFEVLSFCHINRKMGIAYGPAGIGKTCAVKEYVIERPDSFLIEADPAYTERDLFRDLHSRMIGEPSGSVHQMFDACVDRLKDSGRLIIVDEGESLPYKALNMLRRIHDKAGIGIALIGMQRLRANLIGDQRNFAQLYSRIQIAKHLQHLEPEDVEEIVAAALPKKSELWAIYHNASKGIARNLANLLEQSIRLSETNKTEINAKLIKFAAERLII